MTREEMFAAAVERWRAAHRGRAYRTALEQTVDLARGHFLNRTEDTPAEVLEDEGEAFAELCIATFVLGWMK